MPRTSRPLYTRVREILESARTRMARSVNTTQVVANWLVGREIVEEEQQGNKRADYGERLMHALSARLQREYGEGYGLSSLKSIRSFYLAYPELLSGEKGHALRGLLSLSSKSHALRGLSSLVPSSPLSHPARGRSWSPGQLHANLSWTHYRTLLRAESPAARAFYEIEASQQCWSARELERQIASLLFERLAKSRDKAGVRRLATKGQEILSPADIFKDPVVMEFIGLPESHRLVESDVEQALLNQLQSFLLELGKGFAFVARQQRVTLDGDHFYIDLVFYHVVLKCYVLLDLKVGKLTHTDLGQLQLYVNYFDREKRTPGDHPTLGLILCTDKNDAVVKYTLGDEQQKKIFASRYKFHLPTEAALKAEVRRELKQFAKPPPPA